MSKFVLVVTLSVGAVFGAPQGGTPKPDDVSPTSFAELQQMANARSHEQALRVAAREQYFVASFNRLAAALDEFSKSYKATHTIDANQVKCIRDAYRKFEQADKWFRAE